jgi:NAD(P)-dependent dehydrogenase (short-subunit alcohol dehydrogenase family)
MIWSVNYSCAKQHILVGATTAFEGWGATKSACTKCPSPKENLDDKPASHEKVRKSKQKADGKMERAGEVEEIAKLMAYLVSEDNSYMTGSDVVR